MRIGLVTQWYDPEQGAAAVPGVQARALRNLGNDVHVLTGFPNYPTGEVHAGYRVGLYQRETLQGITVHRAPLYPSHDARALRRASNYLSLAAGATAIGLTRLPRVEAALVHATPMTIAIPAVALRLLRRIPFVLHVQDLWPQTVVSAGFLGQGTSGRLEQILNRYCDVIYRHASRIAVTSPGMARLIVKRGVPPRKISVVPNWADEGAFRPVERNPGLAAAIGITRRFTLMYAGNLGHFQALHIVIEAATRLRLRRDIGFVFVGDGVAADSLRTTVRTRGLDNVMFVEPQPFESMSSVLALGDAQLVSLEDLPLFKATLPSKLQAILAAGRPIIGAVAGDAAEVIDRSRAGFVVRPGDTSALTEAIIEVAGMSRCGREALGLRGRRYYIEEFSQAINAQRLADLLVMARDDKRGHR